MADAIVADHGVRLSAGGMLGGSFSSGPGRSRLPNALVARSWFLEILNSNLVGRFPESFQVVELARGFGKDVHDKINVVDQHPVALVIALNLVRSYAILLEP